MASSLEVRSPLLDQKVIEFAAGLPPDLKLHRGTSKYLLKRYAEQRVRRHRDPPAQDGLLDPAGGMAAWRAPGHGRGYFQPPRVRAMWTEHRAGRRDHSHQLWALMMLKLWHRQFLDGGA